MGIREAVTVSSDIVCAYVSFAHQKAWMRWVGWRGENNMVVMLPRWKASSSLSDQLPHIPVAGVSHYCSWSQCFYHVWYLQRSRSCHRKHQSQLNMEFKDCFLVQSLWLVLWHLLPGHQLVPSSFICLIAYAGCYHALTPPDQLSSPDPSGGHQFAESSRSALCLRHPLSCLTTHYLGLYHLRPVFPGICSPCPRSRSIIHFSRYKHFL